MTARLAALATLLAVPATAMPLLAQSPPDRDADDAGELRITTAHGSEAEVATAAALRRLVREHDIPRAWILTREIVVDETEIPHSHPVLTVHTRHLGSDEELLATFLHEQFHWLEDAEPGFRASMDDFARIFPEAPAGGPEGARDRESTWRHLVVNDLELQAMTVVVGEERARGVLESKTYYTWIYRTVLDDPRVREITVRNGMTVTGPDGPGWR